MKTTLRKLNSDGDLKITWDHENPEEVEQARRTVAELKQQGYDFFLVDGATPADEIAAGQGALCVRRLPAEEILPASVSEAPSAEPKIAEQSAPKRGRGRPASRSDADSATDRQVIAVPRQRGG